MIRRCAIKTIEEIFNQDRYGIRTSFTDDQEAAIALALNALKNPECMCCGYCKNMTDEDAQGRGWCQQHNREAYCDDFPCGDYEQ